MSSIKKELNKLAEKVGAPVNGKNISEQIASINVHLEGTSHGANISERINEFREAWGGGDNPPILKNKTITENGVYNAVDDQADGYKKVDVDIPLPVLMDKTVTPTTSQQTIIADQGYDGLGTVTVAAVTSAIDQNIVAANIKKDVQILGVTGSYEGSGGGHNATLEVDGTEFIYTDAVLTSITIPSSVTSIGNDAFNECDGLTSVTIPSSVTSIGDSAFYNCYGLTSVTIPSSVTSIGNSAFSDCTSLADVIISEGVEMIGDNMFNGCTSLTDVTIPSSVTSIGDSAFYGCTSLTDVTISEGVETIGDNMFNGCTSLTAIVIPSSVTSIGSYAFGSCSSLADATISEGVETIYSSFTDCASLTAIVIPSSVTSIDGYAFAGCTDLTTITVHKAEGSISGAPWGAPNATVIWDG